MAKSKQAAGNKQGSSNKSAGGAGKTTNPASKTTGTGNAQAVKPQSESTTNAAVAGLPQPETPEAAGQTAIDALKQDHRRVEGLFAEFETATERQRKQELVAMICAELNIHTRLEEEIFYPACREAIDDEHLMDEAQVEHDAAKLLIADLTEASSDDPFYDAKVKLLSEMIKHHVAEEEQPGEGILAKAEEHDVDNPSLASELAERKQELQRRAARLRPTRAVSFNLDLRNLMEESMARNSDNDRDRDDRGRFTSDRGGGGGGRGRGGWFGDSEGHSRAARSRDDDDDDRGGRG
ncbi:Hemerythrin HHE cation binding domain-containing protein, partial [Rhodospirillales bacterium URHD0017]